MALFYSYIILLLLLASDLVSSQGTILEVNGDKKGKIIENTVVYFSCIATISKSKTKFEDIELAISQPSSKPGSESLCFRDCDVQSTPGHACETFMRETMLHCAKECSVNSTSKNCTFHLQRVSLSVDRAVISCAHGSERSTKYDMSVEVATKLVSIEVKYPENVTVVHKNRTTFLFREAEDTDVPTDEPIDGPNYRYSTKLKTTTSPTGPSTTLKLFDDKDTKLLQFNQIAIDCTFRASKSPPVQWRLTRTLGDNSEKVIEITSTGQLQSHQTGQYQWLSRLLIPAKRESAGKYRCLTRYETTREDITGDIILQPYYGQKNVPSIKMLSSDMIIGQSLLFECNVEDSYPAASITWNSPSSENKIEYKSVKGDFGGSWVSSQLEFPLRSAQFGSVIQCGAAHYGGVSFSSNNIEISRMTFKKKILYNESGEFGIVKEADLKMHLNKSCLSIEATMSDLLRTLSTVFCTADSIRAITGGLVSEPVSFFKHLESASSSFVLNVRLGILRASLQISGQTFWTTMKLEAIPQTNEGAFAMLMQQIVLVKQQLLDINLFKCGQNTFNKSSNKVSFSYSIDGKTVTNNQGNWHATFINGLFLPTHAVSELCIENPSSGNGMYVGIALDSYNPESGVCDADIVAWNTANSEWCNGASKTSTSVKTTPSAGSKIRMIFNPSNGGYIDYLQEDGSSYLNSAPVLSDKMKKFRHRLRFAIWPYSGSTARLYSY